MSNYEHALNKFYGDAIQILILANICKKLKIKNFINGKYNIK